jgi:hypothetical protein
MRNTNNTKHTVKRITSHTTHPFGYQMSELQETSSATDPPFESSMILLTRVVFTNICPPPPPHTDNNMKPVFQRNPLSLINTDKGLK